MEEEENEEDKGGGGRGERRGKRSRRRKRRNKRGERNEVKVKEGRGSARWGESAREDEDLFLLLFPTLPPDLFFLLSMHSSRTLSLPPSRTLSLLNPLPS